MCLVSLPPPFPSARPPAPSSLSPPTSCDRCAPEGPLRGVAQGPRAGRHVGTGHAPRRSPSDAHLVHRDQAAAASSRSHPSPPPYERSLQSPSPRMRLSTLPPAHPHCGLSPPRPPRYLIFAGEREGHVRRPFGRALDLLARAAPQPWRAPACSHMLPVRAQAHARPDPSRPRAISPRPGTGQPQHKCCMTSTRCARRRRQNRN